MRSQILYFRDISINAQYCVDDNGQLERNLCRRVHGCVQGYCNWKAFNIGFYPYYRNTAITEKRPSCPFSGFSLLMDTLIPYRWLLPPWLMAQHRNLEQFGVTSFEFFHVLELFNRYALIYRITLFLFHLFIGDKLF